MPQKQDQPDGEQKKAKQKRRAHGEGSVSLRPDGRWQAQMMLEDGKRKYFYGKTKKEALDKLHLAQEEQRKGTLATGPQQKLESYLEYWLEDVHKQTLRITTYEEYRSILDNHLLPALGHIQVQKLTTQQVQSLYAKKLKDGLSPGWVRVIHVVLNEALEHATRAIPPLIARNVCDFVELPRLEQHEIKPLTREQAQELLQGAQEHHLLALLTLAITTGMRKGEMLALRWKEINMDEGSLHVRRTVSYMNKKGFFEREPKTKKGRRKITLPPFVVEVLKQHRIAQGERRLKAGTSWVEHDLVFCNSTGGFLHASTVRGQFSRLLKGIGLPDIRFHDLRHSAATLVLSMGVNAKVVQELLGHSILPLHSTSILMSFRQCIKTQ